MLLRYLTNAFALCLLIIYSAATYATEVYTGLWTGYALIGPLQAKSNLLYYNDAQLQLLDSTYCLQNVYASLGIGKQVNKKLLLFLNNRFIISRQVNTGQTFYEYRIWQEGAWHFIDNSKYYLSSRTMLEERKRFSQSQIALRLRERIMFRKNLDFWPRHSFVCSEEVFLNLNSPVWVSNQFFSQNRVFIGIGTKLSKSITLDIGYLNQYILRSTNQMNNILYINFNITGKTHYFKE